MRWSRVAAASALLFVLAVVWNGLLHLVILRRANEPLQRLRRTDLHPLSRFRSPSRRESVFCSSGAIAIRSRGSLREGVAYGFFLGLFAATLVDLNQYLLYPLPFTLVSAWFVGGVLEFTLYGAVLSRFFPLRRS